MSTNSTELLITYDSTNETISFGVGGLAASLYSGSVAYTDALGKNTTATVALTISQSVPTPPPVDSGNPYGGGWIGGMPSTENLWPVLVKSGARHMRYQIQWDKIEPTKDSYLWAQVDDFVTLTKTHNLLPTFVVQSAPTWRQATLYGATGHTIPDPAQIGPFVDLLTKRYPPGTFYSIEINNEGYSTGTVLLPQFTTQLLPSLQAVKPILARNSPTTLLGGPAELNNHTANAAQWWQYFYQSGCHHLCDYVNMHYYGPSGGPDVARAGEDTFLQRIKAVTDAQATYHATGQPLWLTEWGWKRLNAAGTNGGIPDSQLAGNITKLLNEAMNSKIVAKVIYFNLGDLAPGNGTSQNFGLQSYAAWAGFIAAHPQWG